MKLLTILKKEKSLYIGIGLLSLIALAPYILATFYLHPHTDDYVFSNLLNEMGRIDFISYSYNKWLGRFFALFLLSLPKADIINSPYWYTIIPNLFMLLTWFSIYKLFSLILKEIVSKFKIIIFSMFFFSFYITGLPEVFSAIFWNCSTYYLIANVFFIWFIYEFVNFTLNDYKYKSFNYLKLTILAFLVCGLTEVYIISLIIILGIIVLFKLTRTKKIKYSILLLILIVLIGGYYNILAPGSIKRMEAGTHHNYSFIYSAFRSFYNLIILQIAPLFYSGILFLLLLILMYGHKIIESNLKLKKMFNLNPFFTFTTVIFVFYLHHAMSLYGAGYILQGRVLNITNLLLYLSLAFVVMNIVTYYKVKIKLNKFVGLISILMIAFSLNFSENSRMVGKEALVDLPIFNSEMNLRYETILKAKKENLNTVYIERISVDLHSLHFGFFQPKKSFYNSIEICDALSVFFKIEVKIKDNDYDFFL